MREVGLLARIGVTGTGWTGSALDALPMGMDGHVLMGFSYNVAIYLPVRVITRQSTHTHTATSTHIAQMLTAMQAPLCPKRARWPMQEGTDRRREGGGRETERSEMREDDVTAT